MAFVLDASISAVWALADESSPLAEIAADRLKNEIAFLQNQILLRAVPRAVNQLGGDFDELAVVVAFQRFIRCQPRRRGGR